MGPEGTFSGETAKTLFGEEKATYLVRSTIEQVIDAVTSGDCDYAVVPVENSTGGYVPNFWKYYSKSPSDFIPVACDVTRNISQHLFSASLDLHSLSSAKRVYSHWQALAQCADFLAENAPDADLIEVSSTAEAVRIISSSPESEDALAIAGAMAGERYDVPLLVEGINDRETNSTRFVVLRGQTVPEDALGFGLPAQSTKFLARSHAPLWSVANDIAEARGRYGLTLGSIFSLPSGRSMGSYITYYELFARTSRCTTSALSASLRASSVLAKYPSYSLSFA